MRIFRKTVAGRAKKDAIVTTADPRPIPTWDPRSIPTWWRHDCGVKHRSRRTFAKCMLGTDDVHGDGAWAILPCWKRCGYSVHLYPTELSARKAERVIDETACGCRDHRHSAPGHKIVRLAPEGR